jgi:hypothetical protein
MTLKDQWWDPYIGKRYNDGSTEVVSMGLQEFNSEYTAGRLFTRDPQMFAFLWTILSGGEFALPVA